MSKATAATLHALHGKVAKTMIDRLEEDAEQGLPTDAATLSAMIKFLKDNNVTADPASTDDLKELRTGLADQLAEQRRKRMAAKETALKMADKDLQALGG